MLYRSVDAYGNSINDASSAPGLIEKKYKNQSVTQSAPTRTVSVPSSGGASPLIGTNAEIVALRALVEGLVTRVTVLEMRLTETKEQPQYHEKSQKSHAEVSNETGSVSPWKALGISRATYFRRLKSDD